IHIPAAWSREPQTHYGWNYMTEPQPQRDNRRRYRPHGNTHGRRSSIDAMVYIRGNPWASAHWAALACGGWSSEEVLPHFKRSHHQMRGEDDDHGVHGPLSVSDPLSPNPMTVAFMRAGQSAGMPYCEDFNRDTQDGIGLYQTTTHNGKRHSVAKAFLVPAL